MSTSAAKVEKGLLPAAWNPFSPKRVYSFVFQPQSSSVSKAYPFALSAGMDVAAAGANASQTLSDSVPPIPPFSQRTKGAAESLKSIFSVLPSAMPVSSSPFHSWKSIRALSVSSSNTPSGSLSR